MSNAQLVPAMRSFYMGRVVVSAAALQAVPFDELVDGSAWVVDDGGTSPLKVYEFKLGTPAAGQTGALAATAGGYFVPLGATGMPMTNRVRMLGAPGAIANADWVTIGAVTFEFRNNTPPTGGTAGRIWVYQGANSAESRANFILACHGVVNAALVTYNGVTPPNFLVTAGTFLGDLHIQSATAPGGLPAPSATATATLEGLTTATDIWDEVTCYGGYLEAPKHQAWTTIAVTAGMIAKGTVEAMFTFAPVTARCMVLDLQRVHNEVWAAAANQINIALTGGASPNIQAADVLFILAQD